MPYSARFDLCGSYLLHVEWRNRIVLLPSFSAEFQRTIAKCRPIAANGCIEAGVSPINRIINRIRTGPARPRGSSIRWRPSRRAPAQGDECAEAAAHRRYWNILD
jgi:hypothetical protein